MAAEEETAAAARKGKTETPETEEEERQKVNRREFLNVAWLASLGTLSIDLGVIMYFFALPRFREGEFGGSFNVGTKYELPEVGSSPAENPKGKFWLTQTEEGILALYKVCTHLGCLYSWVEEEGIFRCPCHGSQFEPDGTFKFGPAPRSLDQFVVQLVDPNSGEVLAETDLENGGPVALSDDPNIVIQVDTGNLLRGKPK